MGRGSPPHEPSVDQRKLVETCAAFGIPHNDIAAVVGIDPKTLRKHYRVELKNGSTKAIVKVASNLYTIATSAKGGPGTVTAAIFFLKTRARWKETSAVENSGPDGKPIQHEHAPNPEALETARRLLDEVAAARAGGFQRQAPVAPDSPPEPDHPAG